MNIKNKLVAVFALAAFVLPLVSSAATVSVASQQAELQTLIAELQALQAQANAVSGGSNVSASAVVQTPSVSPSVTCYTFSANLAFGAKGTAVTALQNALKNDGESVIVTGTYDNQTAVAVSAFQEKYASTVLAPSGLSAGTGYVGAATRTKLNALSVCNQSPTVTPPLVSNPATITVPTLPTGICPAYGCNGPAPIRGPIVGLPITVATSTPSSTKVTVTQNPGFGTVNIAPGEASVKISSYSFSASSVEGVNINTIAATVTPGKTSSAFQNLKLMVNGVQFGITQGAISGNASYSFTGTPFSIPAGGTVNVDVYADSLTSAMGTYTPGTALIGYTGTGVTSHGAISSTATVNGQTINFVGPDALTVSIDSSNPPAGQIVQNSIGNVLAVFRLTATTNVENIKLTQLNVVDAVVSTKTVRAGLSNVTLWNGSTLLGTAATPVVDAAGTGFIYTFNSLSSPLLVPAGNSVSLVLKGDAGSVTNGSLTDGSTVTFEIATTTDSTNNTPTLAVVAIGATSFSPTVVTLANAKANPQRLVRTTAILSGQTTNGAISSNVQQVGTVIITANSAGNVKLNSVRITTNHSDIPFMNTLSLRDPNGNDIVKLDGLATSSLGGFSDTWTFFPNTNPLVISAGSSYVMTLWADMSKFPAPAIGTSPVFTASVSAPTDFSYYDGTTGTTTLLYALPSQVPVTISTLTGPPRTSPTPAPVTPSTPPVAPTTTTSGTPALTVTIDPNTPPAGTIVQNSTGNVLGMFDFKASNSENVILTQLNILDLVPPANLKAAWSNLGNLTLWSGSTLLATSAANQHGYLAANNGYLYLFSNMNIIVPQNGTAVITLKGDAGSVAQGTFVATSTATFEIATTTDSDNNTAALAVMAHGVTSNNSAAVTITNAKANTLQMSATVMGMATPTSNAQTALAIQSLQALLAKLEAELQASL